MARSHETVVRIVLSMLLNSVGADNILHMEIEMKVLVKLTSGHTITVECSAFDVIKDTYFFVDEKQMCVGAIPIHHVVYAFKQEAMTNHD